MNSIIVTGFEPFLQHRENPTEMIVRKLDGRKVGNQQIYGYVLPVSYQQAANQLLKLVESKETRAVVMLGLAANRDAITPERVAINVMDGAEDNDGVQMVDTVIEAQGPAAYFSTLPVKEMVKKLQDKKIPARISNTAGTYVCNALMYRILHELNQVGTSAGFVHVPHAEKMRTEEGAFFTDEALVEAVHHMLSVLA